MKRSIAYKSVQKRGLHIGLLPELAAAMNPATPIDLDHDLDVLPGAGRHMTVTDFAGHLRDLAARLWAVGVRPDDHVVVYKTANADAWLLGAATSRIGAVPVMLSPSLDAINVGALLKRLDQPTLLTDEPKLDVLGELPLADLVQRTLLVRGHRPGAQSLEDLAGSPDVPPRIRRIDAAAVITHTSGTTGIPKLVVHTPRTQAVRLKPQWRLLSLMRRKETVAIHIPFVHSRMVAAMSLALLQEMPVVLLREPSLDKVAEAFLEHRPGFVEALPNSLMEWEPLADDPRKPFSTVKYFSSTFDAIHPRTMSRLLKASTRRGAIFFQIYGQSEVGPAVGRAYFRHSAHRTNGRCVGWQMPFGCAKIRLVSRNGRPVSEENPGYIEVAWSGLAKTYFAEQDRYDENRFGDWWRTGDVGYRTKFGCLHMLDREVDMIGGVRSSLEVEDQVLGKLEELCELVVVHGVKSQPVPVVCTTDDAPLDRDRWRAAVAGLPQLAEPVQIPRAELPRTGTLKVQRLALSRRLKEEMKDRA